MAESAAPDIDGWLPLFPLNTVLFPNGILPLRVFEARYIDMVRDCMKREKPFGVILIRSGAEVGCLAQPEAIGCVAHVTKWDMPDLGVLLLTEGGKRFRVIQQRTLPDTRIEAEIELLAEDEIIPITDMHVACASSLKIVMDDINKQGRMEDGDQFVSPFATPPRLNDAGWVANRWSEILPIPLKARQKLLELTDAKSRLEVVHQYLEQHQII